MNSFNFGRPVEIEGEVYFINSDLKASKEVAEKVRAVLSDENSTLEDQEAALGKALDFILGEGAYKKIFKGRTFNYVDVAGLIIFLTNEINIWSRELQ